MRSIIYVILAAWVIMGGICVAAPEPAVVAGPGLWTLELAFEQPRQVLVEYNSSNKSERFWYTIVTLTNNSGRDVGFYPKCEMMTDTFMVVPACKGVSNTVFERIKLRHQGQYPFLEYLENVDSKILQGEDNAKDIAIIWPEFDAKTKDIKLFIAGLSNETVIINHPSVKDEKGKPVKVYLRKTLELSYGVKGEAVLRTDESLSYKSTRWVMR